jgi:hypothetical protein
VCWVNVAPGGEPLWVLLKDFAIFCPARGRLNMVLNRRLPRITARDVLSIVLFEIIHPRDGPINLSRVETFPGAACLTGFAAIHPPR